MKQLGLTRAFIQACIDSVKTRGGQQMSLIGERVLAIWVVFVQGVKGLHTFLGRYWGYVLAIRGGKRTLTRVVFVQEVKGLHLSCISLGIYYVIDNLSTCQAQFK